MISKKCVSTYRQRFCDVGPSVENVSIPNPLLEISSVYFKYQFADLLINYLYIYLGSLIISILANCYIEVSLRICDSS